MVSDDRKPTGPPVPPAVHTRRGGAEKELSGLVADHLATGGQVDELSITVVPRTPVTS